MLERNIIHIEALRKVVGWSKKITRDWFGFNLIATTLTLYKTSLEERELIQSQLTIQHFWWSLSSSEHDMPTMNHPQRLPC